MILLDSHLACQRFRADYGDGSVAPRHRIALDVHGVVMVSNGVPAPGVFGFLRLLLLVFGWQRMFFISHVYSRRNHDRDSNRWQDFCDCIATPLLNIPWPADVDELMYDHVHFNNYSKGRQVKAKGIDIFVDDDMRHLQDCLSVSSDPSRLLLILFADTSISNKAKYRSFDPRDTWLVQQGFVRVCTSFEAVLQCILEWTSGR